MAELEHERVFALTVAVPLAAVGADILSLRVHDFDDERLRHEADELLNVYQPVVESGIGWLIVARRSKLFICGHPFISNFSNS